MWNITKKVKDTFERSNLLPIHETDDEWEIVIREAKEEGEDILYQLDEEMNEVKEELSHILPKRFHPYIDNGMLNKPSLPISVREDYLSWIGEADEVFDCVLHLAAEQTEKTLNGLSEEVQQVFEQGLHDSIVNRVDRTNDNLQLSLKEGALASMGDVHLLFHGVSNEMGDPPLTNGETIVYYEMQFENDRFHFRMLTDNLEWTIRFTEITAKFN